MIKFFHCVVVSTLSFVLHSLQILCDPSPTIIVLFRFYNFHRQFPSSSLNYCSFCLVWDIGFWRMNVGDLNKVWEIRALKRKPAAEEATKMLEKIAKQVQPIMRKHKWRVKILSEFWYFKFPFSLFIGLFVCWLVCWFTCAMPFIFNYLKEKTYTQYHCFQLLGWRV